MLRRVILLSFILAAASLGGPTACGGGSPTGDDNGNDAAVSLDASSVPDGAVGEDNDQDGYPTDQDCDDNDPAVYPGVMQECTSDCAIGVRGCRNDGTWSTCTASTDCACTTPGETRVIPCGRCGQGSQTCQATGTWSFPSDCQGEGDCYPGTLEDVACEFCGGTGSRLCDVQCLWLPVEGCSGVCHPGEVRRGSSGCNEVYEVWEELCSSECAWETSQPCSAGCLVPPRVGSGDFKDEVCVNGGDFYMGSNPELGSEDEKPKHIVTLSPYLIDIFEVNNDRYRECVQAGVCTEPPSNSQYHLVDHGSCAVEAVTYDQAVTFCQWDGGRVLPTEAQWEKAARGPYPREVRRPWGTAAPSCSLVAAWACGGEWGPFDVDSAPAGNSYYGLYNTSSNVQEWVADWYDALYYAVSIAVDPLGPASGSQRVTRGSGWYAGTSDFDYVYDDTVVDRHYADPTEQNLEIGFRCARPGY